MNPASESALQKTARHWSPPASALTVLAFGLLAIWLAAGSLGWIAPPLQRSLIWLLLGAIVVIAGGTATIRTDDAGSFWKRHSRWILTAGIVASVAMTASSSSVVNILAAAVLLATVALVHSGMIAQTAGPVAMAAVALAVFRVLAEGTAVGWRLADMAGRAEGRWATLLTGKPLVIGASFGGLDFLVVMAALAVAWWLFAQGGKPLDRRGYIGRPHADPRPEGTGDPARIGPKGAAAVVLAIVAAQTAYLVLLALAPDLADMLPPVSHAVSSSASRLGIWTWSNALHAMLPWHLPMLAAGFQIVVAVVLFRAAMRPTPEEAADETIAATKEPRRRERRVIGNPIQVSEGARPHAAQTYIVPAVLLAIAAAAVGLAPLKPDFSGRRIVAYDDGSVDWTTADPGNVAPGLTPRYGLLRALVRSLGGEFAVSKDLNEGDLRDANVLVVLPPGTSKAGDRNAAIRKQIWDFVRNGGGLLVAGEPETRLDTGENALNWLLEPTAISFRDDTANSLTERWEDNFVATSHAAIATSRPGRCSFSVDRAVSLRVSWPAAPLLTGRWCWNELGSDPTRIAPESDPPRLAALPYVFGSRLGDLVLAAQQNVGQGRVVVLGDASCLTNDGIPFSYTFCGPLLSALVEKGASPLAWWRQLIGFAAAVGAVALLYYHFEPLPLVAAAMALALTVLGCNMVNDTSRQLLPAAVRSLGPSRNEGQPPQGGITGAPLIYVDGSHLEATGKNPWREDGVGRFTRVLADGKYLPLLAPDVSAQRLAGARVLISIAPGRAFDKEESGDIEAFVERGGIFLAMTGSPDAGPSRPLFDALNLQMPQMPLPPWNDVPETEPLGALERKFTVATEVAQLPSAQRQPMRFYSAWPVIPAPGANLWPDASVPVLAGLARGEGQAFLLGDSYFASQKAISPPSVPNESDVPQNALFWQTTLRAWLERSQK